jgi:hypothetical protein
MKTALLFLSLALALPTVAHAGDGARPEGARPERGAERGARDQLRGRVQEKMGTWLTTEISTRVGLDATKSAKMSEAIKQHMARKQERMKRLREEMQKLRSLVDAKANDAQTKAQLDTVIGLSSRDDDMHEMIRETAKFMTIQEQAKLALAMPEIMKDMRQMMKEARREMRGKRGPAGGGFGGPGPRGMDDDDEL